LPPPIPKYVLQRKVGAQICSFNFSWTWLHYTVNLQGFYAYMPSLRTVICSSLCEARWWLWTGVPAVFLFIFGYKIFSKLFNNCSSRTFVGIIYFIMPRKELQNPRQGVPLSNSARARLNITFFYPYIYRETKQPLKPSLLTIRDK
jgi:hypothetical protein